MTEVKQRPGSNLYEDNGMTAREFFDGMYPHERKQEVEQTLCGIHTGLDWLVEHAKLGDLSWSDLQEIKDNIKILEAKTK